MKCEYNKYCYAEAIIKITYLKNNKTLNVCLRHAKEIINDLENMEMKK
jgi:transposase